MGGQNGKPKQGQDLISINHPVFQSAKIYNQTKTPYMTIQMAIDQQDFIKWKQTNQGIKKSPQFLLFPIDYTFGDKSFCGSIGTVNITYDLHPYILQDEIQARKKKKSSFQQCQLWFLLFVLAAGKYEMKQLFETKVGDIRPQNIFLNQQGQVKIACVNSWPREKTAYQKSHQLQETFLAPEEMNRLELGGSDEIKNHRSEMFSIGMTILSAGLLENFCDVYDLKKIKFQYQKALKYLLRWANNKIYSEILTALVCNLCQFQPHKRLSEEQLWFWIREYSMDIKKKNNFVIIKPPLKIQKQVQSLRSSKKSSQTNSNLSSRFLNQTINLESRKEQTKKLNREGLPIQKLLPNFSLAQNNKPSHLNTKDPNVILLFGQYSPKSSVPQTNVRIQNIPAFESTDEQFQSLKNLSKSNTTPYGLISNEVNAINKELEQKQVQASFTPLSSKASQIEFNSQKSGNFVYTRRFVNPNTNSLLGQESINESQYHQGIIEKNLQVIQQKNLVTFQESNQNYAV